MMKTEQCLSLAAVALISISGGHIAEAATACAGMTGESGHFEKTIVSSDMERSFILDVAEDYDPTRGVPLVFNFHGLGGTSEGQQNSTDMVARGNAAGFITVHPQGYENSWNAGSCCGVAALQDVPDVQFVRDMVDAISAEYCVDPTQIHVTGFSNGGYMSHRLACEASDIIASAAPVSGLLGVECNPERPVAIHQSHGTADPLVWYNSGVESVEEWAEINGCDSSPEVYYSRANVECVRYEGCNAGADVEMCSLSAVNHRWVDSRFYSTTDEALDFFLAHPLR